jgi:hypothetical protein
VRFLKGTDELEIRRDSLSFGSQEILDYPYIYAAPDGVHYLYCAGKKHGRQQRYYFRRGDVGGGFPTPESRAEYMRMINEACGETVVVPAESA